MIKLKKEQDIKEVTIRVYDYTPEDFKEIKNKVKDIAESYNDTQFIEKTESVYQANLMKN